MEAEYSEKVDQKLTRIVILPDGSIRIDEHPDLAKKEPIKIIIFSDGGISIPSGHPELANIFKAMGSEIGEQWCKQTVNTIFGKRLCG